VSTTAAHDPQLELFLATARAFLDSETPGVRVRELHGRGLAFERDWWRQAAELGWTSLLVSDGLGGGSVSGDGVADAVKIADLFGRTVAPGPLLPVSAVAVALSGASTAHAHSDVAQGLIDGRVVAAWAVEEPGRRFGDPPTTSATRTAGGFRIDGLKDRVEAGSTSDVLLVTARTESGVGQFLVPREAAGVTVTPLATVDLVRDYAAIRFDGAEVSADAAVGTDSETATLVDRATRIVQLLQCAEMVGALDRVFDMTVAWARDRHSFGRPLASYQALKHRFADMKTQLEACRAIVATAARAVSAQSAAAPVTVSAAKAFVGEYAVASIQDCVQLHGGIGVTWEHDLHLYLRRVEVDRALFGTTEEHQERVYALAGGTEFAR
jgi:alkylation response protein AidB-like acyl-CoA dehydrogenase